MKRVVGDAGDREWISSWLQTAPAEITVERLVERRQDLQRQLGRDPGLRVAAIDLLGEERWPLPERDPLTELPYLGSFRRRLASELRRARRYGSSLAVVLFDLIGTRQRNLREGWSAGDHHLSLFARHLRRLLRDSDLVARHGDDRFVVLLPTSNVEQARGMIARARKRPFDLRSVVVISPEDGAEGASLLELLERRLQALKEQDA